MIAPTVLDLVGNAIARNPAAPALIVEGQVVSYRQFLALTCIATRELRQHGIGPGETVALSLAYGPIAIMALLALAQLGAVSVSMGASLGAARADLCRRYGVRRMIVSARAAAVDGVEAIVMERLDARGDETMRGLGVVEALPDAPMRIALASATTGSPQGVLQTHADLARRLQHSYWNTAATARILPPDLHDTAALLMCFAALGAGGVLVFPKGGNDSAAMLGAIQLHGVTHVALSPEALGGLLALLPTDSVAFPSLTHLRVVGGTPSAELLERVRRRCSPNVYVPYAPGELGVVSMATPDTLAREPLSSGYVVANACLEVVDETGRKLPAGASGELRVAVEGMPQGYHGGQDGADSPLRDGWFYPGDRGRLRHDGLLFVEGLPR